VRKMGRPEKSKNAKISNKAAVIQNLRDDFGKDSLSQIFRGKVKKKAV
jgi:hypothetical protein